MELHEIKHLDRTGRLEEAVTMDRLLDPKDGQDAQGVILGVRALMELGRFREAADMARAAAKQAKGAEQASLHLNAAFEGDAGRPGKPRSPRLLPSDPAITHRQNTCHPILPFCYFTLKASRTALRFRNLVQKGFDLKPETLGEHLRSRRLILNLTQEQVAKCFNTVREHYERWERDEVAPTVSFWPRLIGFLGQYPAATQTPADCVLKARRLLGLSQYAFGRKVQAVAENIRKWERGASEPPPLMLAKIQQITERKRRAHISLIDDNRHE